MSSPDPAGLASLLDRHAPLTPVPLSPEVRVFTARSLVEVWGAAEALAGRQLPSPFWAYAWPAGAALARVVLDGVVDVRGLRVLDIGAGGGVASLAAARAGAASVVANDIDPWALATARLAAERQGVELIPLLSDLTREPAAAAGFDVVLCGDLAYESGEAPRQRALLEWLAAGGARVVVADAGRAYFEGAGLETLARYDVDVPRDLEGVAVRAAVVYRLIPGAR